MAHPEPELPLSQKLATTESTLKVFLRHIQQLSCSQAATKVLRRAGFLQQQFIPSAEAELSSGLASPNAIPTAC
jgi:hypothetical protein